MAKPGVVLEHHLEKTLTYLAFFKDSPKHYAFLEVTQYTQSMARVAPRAQAKSKKDVNSHSAAVVAGQAKRAAAEADPMPKVRGREVFIPCRGAVRFHVGARWEVLQSLSRAWLHVPRELYSHVAH